MLLEHKIEPSSQWANVRRVMKMAGVRSGRLNTHKEVISHGVLVVHNGRALLLKDRHSYEYIHVIKGKYDMVTLYRCLSIMSYDERDMLLHKDPEEQWASIFPWRRMPKHTKDRLLRLQMFLPELYELIPSQYNGPSLYIPKGRLSAGESSKDAAIRELREETGIIVHVDDLSGPTIDQYIGTDDNTYTTIVYRCDLPYEPNVTLSPEFEYYRWLPL